MRLMQHQRGFVLGIVALTTIPLLLLLGLVVDLGVTWRAEAALIQATRAGALVATRRLPLPDPNAPAAAAQQMIGIQTQGMNLYVDSVKLTTNIAAQIVTVSVQAHTIPIIMQLMHPASISSMTVTATAVRSVVAGAGGTIQVVETLTH